METITGRKLKFYTHIDRSKCSFRASKFPPLGGVQGAAPPSVNLGPPDIWETIRARSLKCYGPNWEIWHCKLFTSATAPTAGITLVAVYSTLAAGMEDI